MSSFENNSSQNESLTPPSIVETENSISQNRLPVNSRERYLLSHEKMVDWKNKTNTNSWSENVLLAYFSHLSKEKKPSTLWAVYSMIKSTINTKHNINIGTYSKLQAFLKRKSTGFKSKKSKILTSEDIKKFLNEAPDNQLLMTKVSVIK